MKKVIEKYKKWNPSEFSIFLLLTTTLFVLFITKFWFDNDFWFLVNTGDSILKNGFINIETFTIHSGLSFIPQQWLTDVIFSLIYNIFGSRGIYIFIIICSYLIFLLFYKLAYLVSNDRKKSFVIVFFLSFVIFYLKTITTRPQTLDFIIFSLELLLLELYINKNNIKYLFFIPILSVLLINLHASMWLMLFVILIPYFVENIVLKIRKKDVFKLKPLIITTFISLLFGLINPYGIESIKYLFNSYGVKEINTYISEMTPITLEGVGIIVLFVMIIIFYSIYHNKGKNKIRYILLTLGICYLSLKHYKCIVYLITIFPLVVGYNFKSNSKNEEKNISSKDKIINIFSTLFILVLVMFNVTICDESIFKEYADYLDLNANHEIKLYTGFEDGNYLEYRGYKCYIDARAEVFLKNNNEKEDIFSEYINVKIGKINPKEFIEKYDFDYLLVHDHDPFIKKYLEGSSNYIKVYTGSDNESYLYKKVENE